MYTRQQASQLRQAFWSAFGKYMMPVPSADGNKANWINYHTGIKHMYFRMRADAKTASISIDITHPDEEERGTFYSKMQHVKAMLEEQLQEKWEWNANDMEESGKEICTISTRIDKVNVFKQEDWPAIISFFKPRMIALDEFWYNAKDIFI
jgi:hypothetical protein